MMCKLWVVSVLAGSLLSLPAGHTDFAVGPTCGSIVSRGTDFGDRIGILSFAQLSQGLCPKQCAKSCPRWPVNQADVATTTGRCRKSRLFMDVSERLGQTAEFSKASKHGAGVNPLRKTDPNSGDLPDSDVFTSFKSYPMPDPALMAGATTSFVYNWNKPQVLNLTTVSKSKRVTITATSAPPSEESNFLERNPKIGGREDSTISKLSKELEEARAEHREINDISDQLAAKSQYGGGIQYQVAALKKRKLLLKDRISRLELQLETLLRESILEKEVEEGGSEDDRRSADPVGSVLSDMMKRLRELGLRPEQVPPHKDSFFLSLMMALQRVGLRPNGYDFRESQVMGSNRQFPYAAKKSKFEVLKLLSSQADKLNGIGGWKLSSEEFQRYFSKAWWMVPAARDDLFMASAHLYSVRIVVLSLEPEGLDEQVYEPQGSPPRATIYLCRRDAHLISTAPLAKSSMPDVAQPLPLTTASPPSVPRAIKVEEVKRKTGRKLPDVAKEDLDAGLGLLDKVLESTTDPYSQAEAEASAAAEEGLEEDDEVVEDRGLGGRRASSMYGTAVGTRRLFVAVTLAPEARSAIDATAQALRRDFPLDGRLLDDVMRWVDAESYHVTLQTLDLSASAGVDEAVAAVARAVKEIGQGPFSVRTGGLGSFWRSAGSGWGRVPRVVWLGLDGATVGPLVRLHQALGTACGSVASGAVTCAALPFCAHITLGKTRNLDSLAAAERRTLRVLAKWVQDPQRPLGLQQLLLGTAPSGASASPGGRGGGGGGVVGANVGAGRGGKRGRAWVRRVEVDGLTSRQKQGLHKLLRKEGRDLGALNAELAAAAAAAPAGSVPGLAVGEVNDVPSDVGEEGGADAAGRGEVGVQVRVEALSVVEAVAVPGTRRVRYVTLDRIPLSSPDDDK